MKKWNLNGNEIRPSGSEALLSDALRRRIQSTQPQPIQQMAHPLVRQQVGLRNPGTISGQMQQQPQQTSPGLAQVSSRMSVRGGQQQRPISSTAGTYDGQYGTARRRQMETPPPAPPGNAARMAQIMDDRARMTGKSPYGTPDETPTPQNQLDILKKAMAMAGQATSIGRDRALTKQSARRAGVRLTPTYEGANEGVGFSRQALTSAPPQQQPATTSTSQQQANNQPKRFKNNQEALEYFNKGGQFDRQGFEEYAKTPEGQANYRDDLVKTRLMRGKGGTPTVKEIVSAYKALGYKVDEEYVYNQLAAGKQYTKGSDGDIIIGFEGDELVAGGEGSGYQGSYDYAGSGAEGEDLSDYVNNTTQRGELLDYGDTLSQKEADTAGAEQDQRNRDLLEDIDANKIDLSSLDAAHQKNLEAQQEQFARQQALALRAASERAARSGMSPEQMQAGLSGTQSQFASQEHLAQAMANLEHEKNKVNIDLKQKNDRYQALMHIYTTTTNAEEAQRAREEMKALAREKWATEQYYNELNAPGALEKFGVGALGALGTVAAGVGGLFTGGATWAAIPAIAGATMGALSMGGGGGGGSQPLTFFPEGLGGAAQQPQPYNFNTGFKWDYPKLGG